MTEGIPVVAVDDMNQRILKLLKMDGKMTYREIASKLRRSPSTVRDRIRRMEEYKVILGYAAIVNNELMGMQSDAIVLANIGDGVTAKDLRKLHEVDGVMEVLLVSGGRRVMVRLNAPDNHTLDNTIATSIMPLGLKDVEVRIVLESVMRFPGV
jgi:Lrp/AsnC family leucine-responsive transcriptional regulator